MSTKPFSFNVQPPALQPPPVTPPSIVPPTCAVSVNDTCLDAAKHTYSYQNGVLTVSDAVVTLPPPPPTALGIGVKVKTISAAPVRNPAGSTSVGNQPAGAQGTVTAGPVTANGFPWWNVQFDTGVSGWVGADNLSLLSSGVPSDPSHPQS